MSKPSFSNIDLWLFELAEGNLSPEQVAQLELFLLQHPELDVDRDMWEMARVNADPVTYPAAETSNRRRPAAMYAAIGSTLFILLTFVGCYEYFGLDSMDPSNGKAQIAGVGHKDNDELINEIKELKADLRSLESENLRLANRIDEMKNGGNKVTANASQNSSNANRTNEHSLSNVVASYAGSGSGSPSSYSSISSGGIDPAGLSLASGSVTASTFELEDRSSDASKSVNKGSVRTYAPRTIEYDWFSGRGYFSETYASNAKKFKTDDRKTSLKNRLNKFSRAIQRAMDNPIALKNSRDPHYHVPGMLPQDVNFGANGTLLTTRVQTMSRIQWLGAENEQMMNQLAVDGYSYGMRGGLGVQLNHSMYKNGGIHVADVAFTYSPKFSVSKWVSVEPALRFKMGNKLLNHQVMDGVAAVEVDRGDVYDYYSDGTNPLGTNLWYKDLGAGLMVNTKWFFAGVQVDDMLRHRDNIYSFDIDNPRRAAAHTVVTLGTDFESIDKKKCLSGYVVYQNRESLNEAWLGFNARWGILNIGGAVSSNIDPAASIGLKFKRFAINYNADYTTSALTDQRALSHQISLRFLAKTSGFGQRLLNL